MKKVNLMNLIKELQDGGYYKYDNEGYKRITAEKKEDFNSFRVNREKEIVSKLSRVVLSDNRLNVSIGVVIEGEVVINPVQAIGVGLESNKIASKIYRNQSILRNGKLNMDKINVYVTKEKLDNLYELGYKGFVTEIGSVDVVGEEMVEVEINLKGMELVDDLGNIDLAVILPKVIKRDKLISKRKVLKSVLEEVVDKSFMGGIYSIEQEKLLREYGLNDKGEYIGIGKKVEIIDEDKFYVAKDFKFTVKGQASLPSVNAVKKKIEGGKKLNAIESYMEDELSQLEGKSVDEIKEELRNVELELNAIKDLLFAIRLHAMLNNMGEFDGVDIDKKGDMIYKGNEGILIIKVENVKVYN